jgi:hexosaminidase
VAGVRHAPGIGYGSAMRTDLAATVLLALAACHPAPDEPVDDTDPDAPADTDVADVAAPRLVPRPAVLEPSAGAYRLDATTAIHPSTGAEATAALLAAALRPSTGLPLPVQPGEGGITLVLDDTLELPAEGYTLDADADGVTIRAADEAGLFHGTQTLRQLLPPASLSDHRVDGVAWRVPAVHVEDAPRFAWRGLMIDVARHFFPVEVIERQIDLMALHHLSRLHLHLSDDQGWRLEITSWPDLTTIGGATEVGGGEGGFYTQDEYAAIVAYAAARHVVVVPELDMPGHAHAALVSYPELNEDGVAPPPYTGRPVLSDPLWVDGEITADLVADVWREVAALTPGPWVHLGGDEAVDVPADAYRAFVAAAQQVIAGEGKTMIGWDEIGDVDLEPTFVAQHWWHADRARAAVAQGGKLVASPANHAYLDMVHELQANFGQVWAGPIDVQRAYAWDPVLDGVDEADVLGVEGALWTEQITTEARLGLMLWPRLAALAEVGWTAADDRDWDDFRARLGWHGARLEALDVDFYRDGGVAWTPLGRAD